MALGVTSCLTDDEEFTAFVTDSFAAPRSGGSLILVDSLSRRGDALTSFASGYVARYRDRDAYVRVIEAAGFVLVEELDLGKPSRNRLVALVPGRRMNRMFWFRR